MFTLKGKEMKKKLLLVCLIVMSLMCLFAISVSAATAEIDGLIYDLQSNGTARLGKNANQNVAMETIIIPEKVTASDGKEYTVTEIYEGSFRNNKNIKYISLPPTIRVIGGAAFNSCSNLVFIDFNDNQNEISASGWGIMRGCDSLKAICLPDNMKTVGDQFLTGAKALTAVYLPANVELIKGNKNDGPAFGNCPNMYLVNEKFEVRDENGEFYTAENFVIPDRPYVYYFPSTLKAITGAHNVSTSFTMDENGIVNFDYYRKKQYEDCAFYNLPNINPVLVLPESYQGFDDRVLNSKGSEAQYSDHKGDTIASGLFQYCGTKEKPLTVVFLGEINRVSMGRKGESAYTTYMFVNPKNTGLENTTIGTWYDVNDGEFKDQNETYLVFCNGNNKEGTKYKIEFIPTVGNELYPQLKSELQEDSTVHIADRRKDKIVSQPSCVTDMLVDMVCFCDKLVKENQIILGTSIGHEYSLEKGASKFKIEYSNYLSHGKLFIKCARCDSCNESYVLPIINDFKGFSVSEKGDGITLGYVFDYDAIKEFETVNNTEIEFGFVLGIKSFLGDKMPLDNGVENGIVKVAAEENKHPAYDFIIRGIWDKTVTINEEEINLKDVELYMAGYIITNGVTVYLNTNGSSNSPDTITFAQCNKTV